MAHPQVAEAAVVPMPHELKGESIYAYITLVDDVTWSEALRKELRDVVRRDIGPLATPEVIQFVGGMPKTCSGKIIRRMLRKVAAGVYEDFGDITTLAHPEVMDEIIAGCKNLKEGRPEA